MRSPVEAFKHSTVSLLSSLWNRINFPPETTGALKPAPIAFFHNCLGLRSAFGEIADVDVPFRCGPGIVASQTSRMSPELSFRRR